MAVLWALLFFVFLWILWILYTRWQAINKKEGLDHSKLLEFQSQCETRNISPIFVFRSLKNGTIWCGLSNIEGGRYIGYGRNNEEAKSSAVVKALHGMTNRPLKAFDALARIRGILHHVKGTQDFVQTLQNWALDSLMDPPEFVVLAAGSTYTVECRFRNKTFTGSGYSRVAARHDAAEQAIYDSICREFIGIQDETFDISLTKLKNI